VSDIDKTIRAHKAEVKRVEDAAKSYDTAAAWVEANVPEKERCVACSGIGIEQKDGGVYAYCVGCKGTGKPT